MNVFVMPMWLHMANLSKKVSSRRKPGPSLCPKNLDSGFCRNDDAKFSLLMTISTAFMQSPCPGWRKEATVPVT
jgi:hypothetical protein